MVIQMKSSNQFKLSKEKAPADLTELSIKLAGAMIYLAGKAKSLDEGYIKAENSVANGLAYKKFEHLVQAQGGDLKQVRDYNLLPIAKEETHLYAKDNGYLSSIETKQLGQILIEFKGAGRKLGKKLIMQLGSIVIFPWETRSLKDNHF